MDYYIGLKEITDDLKVRIGDKPDYLECGDSFNIEIPLEDNPKFIITDITKDYIQIETESDEIITLRPHDLLTIKIKKSYSYDVVKAGEKLKEFDKLANELHKHGLLDEDRKSLWEKIIKDNI